MSMWASVFRGAKPDWLPLEVCAAIAPFASIILYGLAGLVVGNDEAAYGLVWIVWPFIVLQGYLPSFVFGALACVLAERFLSGSRLYVWALAGVGAALAYIGVMLGLAVVSLDAAKVFGPWVVRGQPRDISGMALWVAPLCISLAGGLAGMTYRIWARRRLRRALAKA